MRTILLTLALCAASPAWADITDSGDLIIGGQGIIAGTMTVQGSAFSVGTSTLAVSAGNLGVGTASPTSKLQVVDGDIRIATTTGSRGIIFQDGTTQVTAGVSGTFDTPAVFNSSVTVNGSIFAGWEKVSYDNSWNSTSSVSCSAGKRLLGGGCIGTSTGYYLIRNGPNGNTAWECEWNGANATRIAYAICAKFENN